MYAFNHLANRVRHGLSLRVTENKKSQLRLLHSTKVSAYTVDPRKRRSPAGRQTKDAVMADDVCQVSKQ